jgi:hypothetical protein
VYFKFNTALQLRVKRDDSLGKVLACFVAQVAQIKAEPNSCAPFLAARLIVAKAKRVKIGALPT